MDSQPPLPPLPPLPSPSPSPPFCPICSKEKTSEQIGVRFKDEAHLLTHALSAGHATSVAKLELKRDSDPEANEFWNLYLEWQRTTGIRRLLRDRTEKNEAKKRKAEDGDAESSHQASTKRQKTEASTSSSSTDIQKSSASRRKTSNRATGKATKGNGTQSNAHVRRRSAEGKTFDQQPVGYMGYLHPWIVTPVEKDRHNRDTDQDELEKPFVSASEEECHMRNQTKPSEHYAKLGKRAKMVLALERVFKIKATPQEVFGNIASSFPRGFLAATDFVRMRVIDGKTDEETTKELDQDLWFFDENLDDPMPDVNEEPANPMPVVKEEPTEVDIGVGGIAEEGNATKGVGERNVPVKGRSCKIEKRTARKNEPSRHRRQRSQGSPLRADRPVVQPPAEKGKDETGNAMMYKPFKNKFDVFKDQMFGQTPTQYSHTQIQSTPIDGPVPTSYTSPGVDQFSEKLLRSLQTPQGQDPDTHSTCSGQSYPDPGDIGSGFPLDCGEPTPQDQYPNSRPTDFGQGHPCPGDMGSGFSLDCGKPTAQGQYPGPLSTDFEQSHQYLDAMGSTHLLDTSFFDYAPSGDVASCNSGQHSDQKPSDQSSGVIGNLIDFSHNSVDDQIKGTTSLANIDPSLHVACQTPLNPGGTGVIGNLIDFSQHPVDDQIKDTTSLTNIDPSFHIACQKPLNPGGTGGIDSGSVFDGRNVQSQSSYTPSGPVSQSNPAGPTPSFTSNRLAAYGSIPQPSSTYSIGHGLSLQWPTSFVQSSGTYEQQSSPLEQKSTFNQDDLDFSPLQPTIQPDSSDYDTTANLSEILGPVFDDPLHEPPESPAASTDNSQPHSEDFHQTSLAACDKTFTYETVESDPVVRYLLTKEGDEYYKSLTPEKQQPLDKLLRSWAAQALRDAYRPGYQNLHPAPRPKILNLLLDFFRPRRAVDTASGRRQMTSSSTTRLLMNGLWVPCAILM
ncbi:hypothetical protein N7532_011210 [Penicillium argentinense]|uniref:Uncharacterized protein n=1 Tax=Penicillium argentinense TaxID=1131581 RepID=A0A9W9EHZ4_9EURO|nr:uncharacterized protein N7532_011210 [Penicillium argentinense]KAJ5082167.1 hypothetical protein N7532_011210 [Penicillium argentinense]